MFICLHIITHRSNKIIRTSDYNHTHIDMNTNRRLILSRIPQLSSLNFILFCSIAKYILHPQCITWHNTHEMVKYKLSCHYLTILNIVKCKFIHWFLASPVTMVAAHHHPLQLFFWRRACIYLMAAHGCPLQTNICRDTHASRGVSMQFIFI